MSFLYLVVEVVVVVVVVEVMMFVLSYFQQKNYNLVRLKGSILDPSFSLVLSTILVERIA